MRRHADYTANREEVKYGFARMLFAVEYGSYAEEQGYLRGFRGDWYYDLEDMTGKSEPIPQEAWETAEKALQQIEKANGIDFDTFVPPNEDKYEYIEDAESLGAALALHWTGANADREDAYELEVPDGEFYWYPDNDEEWYPDEPAYRSPDSGPYDDDAQ